MKLFIAALLFVASEAWADCPQFFPNETLPVITNEKLANKTTQLCFLEFTVLHSGISRGPLWSAEHLTGEHIKTGEGLPRRNQFHEEYLLPEDQRSRLDDYEGNVLYDRGHMSPNGDMSSEEAKEESFSLANMVPQSLQHNQGLWLAIENAVRKLAKREGEIYIVTGPAFLGEEFKSLNDRVWVPTHIFKAVYIPSRNKAAAYWTPNDDSYHCEIISIARLKELTGIDVFAGLSDTVKQTVSELPAPPAP